MASKTHIHTQPFYGSLDFSRTTRVSLYQKKHSLTHTYPDHQSSFICYLHLLRSTASSLFNLRAWQSFCTTSIQVFFGPSLGLAPSTSYSIHFFTQSYHIKSKVPLKSKQAHISTGVWYGTTWTPCEPHELVVSSHLCSHTVNTKDTSSMFLFGCTFLRIYCFLNACCLQINNINANIWGLQIQRQV